MPFNPMTFENTTHPEIYFVRPGNGSYYTRIQDITITEKNIVFNIAGFLSEDSDPEIFHIEITDPTCIEILPALLKGDISCFEALKRLEKHFCNRYGNQYIGDNSLPTIRRLIMDLCGRDPFVKLCQFFPHINADRNAIAYTTPVKAVDNEIIQAVKQYVFDNHSSLQKMLINHITKNFSLFKDKINTDNLPEHLVGSIMDKKY